MGRGTLLYASADLMMWRALMGSTALVRVREPGEPAFEPGHRVCSEDGPRIDLGHQVCVGTLTHAVDAARRHAVGHMAVERRGMDLHGVGRPLPSLPEAAHEGGARPWPVASGWAWAWEDTLYRCAPSGKVTVAARLPGPIRAWDVGPRGAVWCVGAGCLWWAPPKRSARRLPFEQVDDAGIDLDSLGAGQLLFSDDGQQAIVAESPGAWSIGGKRPGLASAAGAVGWMPDHTLAEMEEVPAVRASPVGSSVLRVGRSRMLALHKTGRRAEAKLCLPAPPLDMRAHADDAVTVLTARGALGLTVDGRECAPDLGVLLDPQPEVGRLNHGDHDTWWSADGGVVTGLSPR